MSDTTPGSRAMDVMIHIAEAKLEMRFAINRMRDTIGQPSFEYWSEKFEAAVESLDRFQKEALTIVESPEPIRLAWWQRLLNGWEMRYW